MERYSKKHGYRIRIRKHQNGSRLKWWCWSVDHITRIDYTGGRASTRRLALEAARACRDAGIKREAVLETKGEKE